MPRGQARRKGDVAGFRIQWSLVVQVSAMLLAGVGIYVGLSVKLAILDERVSMLREDNAEMKAQIESVRRNSDGLEKYLIDLNRSVQSRVR